MGQTPHVSVIVPVYNIKEYLPRCVASICNQTYTDLEILLVDDGSTDGTSELCDELALKDERIRVFHKENGGSSSARNLGIANAKGTFLGFVDSDDYIEPWFYERLVEGQKKTGAKIVQIGRDEVDEKGNKLPNICEPPKEDIFIPAKDFMKELLMHRGDCSFCTKLVDRTLFDMWKFPLGVLNEDFHILVQMLKTVDGVYSLSGQGYHVFYRIGSNTRKQDKKEFSRVYRDNVDNADMVYEIVREHFVDLSEIAERFGFFQRLDYLLHIPIAQMDKENVFYQSVYKYVRKNMKAMFHNAYLSRKDKMYLLLLGIAPRMVRKGHAFLKRM